MNIAESIKQELFQSFEARGTVEGHTVRIADFAAQMSDRGSPADLAGIEAAFAELVAAGVFELHPPADYVLTAKGLDDLRGERAQLPA